MSFVRKLALYGLLFLVASVLTGCIESDYHVRLNKDESVDISVTVGLDQSIVDSEELEGIKMMQGLYDSLVEQGFAISDYSEDNFIGVRGTKHLASYADLINTDGSVIGITRDDSLFYRKYRIQGEFNLSSMDDEVELVEDSFTKFLYDSFDLKFRLTLPGMVTSHNANSAANHTLVWEVKMGKNNPITAEIVVLKPWVTVLATLLGLAVLGGLAVSVKRRMRPIQKAS